MQDSVLTRKFRWHCQTARENLQAAEQAGTLISSLVGLRWDDLSASQLELTRKLKRNARIQSCRQASAGLHKARTVSVPIRLSRKIHISWHQIGVFLNNGRILGAHWLSSLTDKFEANQTLSQNRVDGIWRMAAKVVLMHTKWRQGLVLMVHSCNPRTWNPGAGKCLGYRVRPSLQESPLPNKTSGFKIETFSDIQKSQELTRKQY